MLVFCSCVLFEQKLMEGKSGGGYLRMQEKRESYTPLLLLLTCTQGLVMCWQTDSMDSTHDLCNLCVVRCACACNWCAWKKPGSYCKDELDIAYEELQPDKKGMLKYDCWTADKSNFIIIAPQKVSASVNIICTSTCLFLFETFSL